MSGKFAAFCRAFLLLALGGCNSLSSPQPGQRAAFSEARMQFEFDLLKDPRTGRIPAGVRSAEMAFARSMDAPARMSSHNYWMPAGPLNVGGRTRAIAYDVRYNGTSNRVILAGGVSGGIFRSGDGGQNWQMVGTDLEIHSIGAIAQDPRPGFQNTWYAGGGEAYGSSTFILTGDLYLGHGLFRSTDNGLTWSRVPFSSIFQSGGFAYPQGQLEVLDHPFDNVHRIAVHPQSGAVYIAGYNAVLRSTDGGSSFHTVFAAASQPSQRAGQTEVALAGDRILIAVNGSNSDEAARGVWISTSGDAGSWQRIAGGPTPGVDGVAGWRGNVTSSSDPYTTYGKRIVLAVAPSNPSIVYVCYVNGLRASGANPSPEVDLFRLDLNGTAPTWTNRSANLPGVAPGNIVAVQLGYDLFVAVKPDQPDFVLLGSVILFRSTNGFATSGNTVQMGNVHPDQHAFAFRPQVPTEGILANDGGLVRTTSLQFPSPGWQNIPNYQTLQYYYVSIDPESGRNNFAGGAQDNGIAVRDATGLFGTPPADSNRHRFLLIVDGAANAIARRSGGTQFVYGSWQLGNLLRYQTPSTTGVAIRPDGLTPNGGFGGFGEFITNFELDQDNSEDLYFVNFNRLFRTTSASTVASSSGWTELTGVRQAVAPQNPTGNQTIAIRGMALSRGPYLPAHCLYFGTTSGKIFRLNDPRGTAPASLPVDITPPGLSGNVQDIAVNPNDDNEIMAVVSNYNTVSIWWTANAKASVPTWKNAEGNLTLPSVRSCAIVVRKDSAGGSQTDYYAGTSVGLFSTTNLCIVLQGNASPVWQREGGTVLHYPIVQSLAYRPSDNVLLVGTHGNGMYYAQVGPPDFRPNSVTALPPALNDPAFIRLVAPTLSTGSVQFRTGSMSGVKGLKLEVYHSSGQLLRSANLPYRDGRIDLPWRGPLILVLSSPDRRYRQVTRVLVQ